MVHGARCGVEVRSVQGQRVSMANEITPIDAVAAELSAQQPLAQRVEAALVVALHDRK